KACRHSRLVYVEFFFFQAEDGIRDFHVTGVQTCALPIVVRELPDRVARDEVADLLSARGRDGVPAAPVVQGARDALLTVEEQLEPAVQTETPGDLGGDRLGGGAVGVGALPEDRKSTRLNSSHVKS